MKNALPALFEPEALTRLAAERAQELDLGEQAARRRSLLRWLGWGSLGTLLSQTFAGSLFGFLSSEKGVIPEPVIDAEAVDALAIGEVKLIQKGRFFLSRVPEGFLALSTRCPHLGCTVPWRGDESLSARPSPGLSDASFATAGRFHCPCHHSIYNRYGEVMEGPATRPMDRYPVTIQDGRILVATGRRRVIERPRTKPGEATPFQA